MAAAVASLPATNQLDNVLPPSALAQNSARHGRSRGMSFKGKGAQGRRYSVVEDSDKELAKALMFVLKRTIKEDEVDEDEEVDNVVADADGWVGVDDIIEHPKIAALEPSLEDIQRVIDGATKARFEIRQLPKTKDDSDPASFEVRLIKSNRDSASVPVTVGEKLTLKSADLPEFLVYETSYQRYPLLVTVGGIAKAPGGTEYLTFTPASDASAEPHKEGPEVSIWINLRAALEAAPHVVWRRVEGGASIVTSDEVPKSLWTKAVARRPDIGVLLENGLVKKEVPAGLRGKGGKARKGKGVTRERAAGSASGGDSSAVEDDEE
ncbi:hypothetical protein QBC39DRAFT_361901 [Podospora conica]|nr:hypothetical protein QBC39DRAFT_361901 [Schizothecium conicum]